MTLPLLTACEKQGEKYDIMPPNTTPKKVVDISSTSSIWKEVNNQNFWSKIPNYHGLGIAFSYPDNLYFQCCGDRDDGSVHMITTLTGTTIDTQEPYILMMQDIISCRIEDIGYFETGKCKNPLSDKENFDYLTILSGGVIETTVSSGFVEVSRDWIMTRKSFSNKDRGFVFQKNGGIYIVQFYNSQSFGSGFIEDFFSRIHNDTTSE